MKIHIDRVYEVPKTTDEDGSFWYQRLRKAYFNSAQIGWAIGSGQVLKMNVDYTWENLWQDGNIFPFSESTDVVALNEKTCWLLSLFTSQPTKCCVTKDGGKTWSPVNWDEDMEPHTTVSINNRSGWVLCINKASNDQKVIIFFSENEGTSWSSFSTDIHYTPKVVKSVNEREGWGVFRQCNNKRKYGPDYFYHINFFDKKLTKVAEFRNEIYDFSYSQTGNLYVVGERGTIYCSLDDGINWNKIHSGTYSNLNGISSSSEFNLAIGDFGTICLSKLGEEKWYKMPRIREENFVNVSFKDNTSGILISSQGIYSFYIED